MKKISFISIVFVMFSLLVITPVIFAEEIQDSSKFIQQQLDESYAANGINLQFDTNTITQALMNSPEFQRLYKKMIITVIFIFILVIIELILKGFAMWKASKKNSKVWFWILLIVNTAGVLPLLYLIFSKKSEEKKKLDKKK